MSWINNKYLKHIIEERGMKVLYLALPCTVLKAKLLIKTLLNMIFKLKLYDLSIAYKVIDKS